MGRDWEATFSGWCEPASDAEEARYRNTRKAINDALRSSPRLARYTFDVYAKGSYPAFTNVVRDSDVDVAVELTEVYYNEYVLDAEGLTLADVGGTPYTGEATLAGFKDDIEAALVDAFGAGAVDRGKKALHIRQSSRSLMADVVPCVTHKTWISRGEARVGVQLRNDARPGDLIKNYPKQHLENGTAKNDNTSRRYKRVARILKRLENEMVANNVIAAVPSFLIESAVYNVPDTFFAEGTWRKRVAVALSHIFVATQDDGCVCSMDWLEVNRCKYLFYEGQNWPRETANTFALEAWRYAGLGS